MANEKAFCDRVRRGVAGNTREEIMDAIRAEFDLPRLKARTDRPDATGKSTSPESTPEGEIMTNLTQHALKLRDIAQSIPYSIPALLARAAIAGIFWRAASTKLANFDLTIALFQDEYLRNLPFLPAAPMAYLATGVEITMPALILAGLLTRLATLPLIGMTLFIQVFVYPTSWPDHLIWIALLTLLLSRGAGAVSIDALMVRLCGNRLGSALRASD